MSLAFIFPGQGSQAVGMGAEMAKNFATARAVWQEVDDALGQNLFQLMCDGPESELTLTENAQPALMAASLAVVRVLDDDFSIGVEGVTYVAGHSLGEYSALAAAEALGVGETARLLKLRGQAMQRAVPVGQGAMASLIGPKTDLALAKRPRRRGARPASAWCNDNTRATSSSPATRRAWRRHRGGQGLGARAMPLNVSAPFHCPLMQPARREMDRAAGRGRLVDADGPVVPT
jgi:[acyl-carrier-protein] S-malonyltransferase